MATDAERLYKRYILDFMHILKFFDEWVIDTAKKLTCDQASVSFLFAAASAKKKVRTPDRRLLKCVTSHYLAYSKKKI